MGKIKFTHQKVIQPKKSQTPLLIRSWFAISSLPSPNFLSARTLDSSSFGFSLLISYVSDLSDLRLILFLKFPMNVKVSVFFMTWQFGYIPTTIVYALLNPVILLPPCFTYYYRVIRIVSGNKNSKFFKQREYIIFDVVVYMDHKGGLMTSIEYY
jgi:hypothetical protein